MTKDKIFKPDAILFDWDSTIIEPNKKSIEAFNYVIDLFKTKKKLNNRFRYMSTREAFPIIFEDKWQEAMKLFYSKLKSNPDQPILIKGAKELIQYISELNIYTAIVSNKNIDILESEISYLSFGHYFNKIVGSGSTPYDKPSTEPIIEALQNSKIDLGKNVWFVGDSIIDLECATKANCTRVLYEYKKICTHDIEPEIKIVELSDLITHIKRAMLIKNIVKNN